MFTAIGATVTVTACSITVRTGPLREALGEPAVTIPIDRVVTVTVIDPTMVVPGRIIITWTSQDAENETETTIDFPPGANETTRHVAEEIKLHQAGGTSFLAIATDTPSNDWGATTTLWATTMTNGRISDEVTCDLTDANGRSEAAAILASAPAGTVVAHNAFKVLSALTLTGVDVPSLSTTLCTLALARAIPTPHCTTHSLAEIATTYGVDTVATMNDSQVVARLILALCETRNATSIHTLSQALGIAPGRTTSDGTIFPSLVILPGRTAPTDAGRGTNSTTPAVPDATFAASTTVNAATSAGDCHSAPAAQDVETKTKKPPRARFTSYDKFSTPDIIPEPNPDADPFGPLFGANVTLSGDFGAYSKGELWDHIADAGGLLGKNVTKKTTILVTGYSAAPTSKERKAREYAAKGQDLVIWPFHKLLDVLNLSDKGETPPF